MEEYKVIYDKGNKVKIKSGCLEFTISKSSGLLISLINYSSEVVDVVIPHIFPTGHCINLLSRRDNWGSIKDSLDRPYRGHFGKMTISDGINIGASAFYESDINEIVWPNDCSLIPSWCFGTSRLKKITNIDNVNTIESHAFANSLIEEIKWPSKCKAIPSYCFKGSHLKNIYNLECVEDIGPYAFYNSDVQCLDLTNAALSHLEPVMFVGIPPECNVIPPYYVTKEDFEKISTM